MRNRFKQRIWLYALLLITNPAFSQEFAIRKVELAADGLILHYDLNDTISDRLYSIYVYSSQDNYIAPLNQVSGDVGLKIRPGNNRKIIWNARQEFGSAFNGDIALEVRGRVYIPFLRLERLKEVQTRQKSFLVKWSGGSAQNILNFQLHRRDGKLVHTFQNAANNGEYRITIPASVKPGKYYFRISDTKNRDQVIESQEFVVKRRYPLSLKGVLALGAAYAVYMILAPEVIVEDPPGTPD